MSGPVRTWEYVVEPPDDGWVWLPQQDEQLAAWAQEVCDDLFATGALAVRLGEQLRAFAVPFREREHDVGAVWVPDVVHGVLASLTADRIVLEAPLERLADAHRSPSEPGLAPPQVELVTLPAGPALRVRRYERAGTTPAGDAVVESVTHVLAPEGLVDVDGAATGVELVVTWSLLHEGDALAELADDTARLLRITTP